MIRLFFSFAVLSFAVLGGTLYCVPVYGDNAAKTHTDDVLLLSRQSFNPSTEQEVELIYHVPVSQAITVRVYDPDKMLVRTLLRDVMNKEGEHRVKWDGKDDAGNIVPNEAYTFVVEGTKGLVLDPWVYSGGVVEDITNAVFDPQDDTVKYTMPEAVRVLIRLGVKNGPMYKTLVDWEPRVGGQITEYWNGQDENQLFDLRAHKDFTALVTYVTLPKATVVTFGNKKMRYSQYKRELAQKREKKTARPWQGPSMLLRPANLVPPLWIDALAPSMVFLDHKENTKVKGQVKIRVDVSDIDHDVLANDQYEIIFYVDDIFFGEAERGHLPFNWAWELHQFPPGQHRLTVNISSAKGMIGVVSKDVDIDSALK